MNIEEADFKPIGGNLTYINGKKLADAGITGEILIGTFSSVDENDYGKSYAFTLAKEVNLEGLVDLNSGDTLVLNGCSTVDRQMNSVANGQLCKVVYSGKKESKNGKSFHAFDILVA